MACRRQMPDVILLDGHMPLMSGIDFLRSLRSETKGNHPVVLYCTTENDVAHISEAMAAGADEYILKPYDKALIEDKLAEVGLVQAR
jgi:two-component system chemotaxis response regulator CheY